MKFGVAKGRSIEMKQARGLWVLATAVALWASPAWAAVEYQEVGDLTAGANQIVVGDVIEVTSFWNEDHTLIKSRIVVAVDQYLVGEGTGIEVLVQHGGTVGDMTLVVSVLPTFEEGDHVLLFLGDREWRLVGCFQGAYLTDGQEIARMAPGCGRILGETIRPLAEVLAEIQQALPLGTKLPDVGPYTGDFEMPLGELRYALCGRDWTYKANPMGEDYRINPNCADAQAGTTTDQINQIRNGMDVWTNAGADFAFSYGGTSTQTAVSQNGTNLIYFDLTPPGGGYIAANFSWGSPSIIESDIVYNDADYVFWNGQGSCTGGSTFDIWDLASHELGHTLCLGDLYGFPDSQKTMYGYGSPCSIVARDLHSDDIAGIIAIYGTSYDPDPPEPDPMSFSTPPTPVASNHVYMIATTATDELHEPCEYYFDCVTGSGGCDDSGWMAYTVYEDLGLNPNAEYSYRVKARDSAVPPNETAYSGAASTYTHAAVPSAPTMYNITSTSMDLDVNPNGNPSYTEFAVQSTVATGDPAWQSKYVNASGDPVSSAVWQTEAQWDGTTIDGLLPETEYCFRAKARNENLIETSFSSATCVSTLGGGSATIVSGASIRDHSGTELPLDLTASSVEPRQGGVLKLEFEVSESVSSVSASVSCVNNTYGGTITTTANGTTVTVEFSTGLPDQDACEVTLSGDVSDSICVRPLEGDIDRGGLVSTGDASIIKPKFGDTPTGASAEFDFDVSGLISTGDFSQVKPKFGNAAPACP
jgi:hypothetical protein